VPFCCCKTFSRDAQESSAWGRSKEGCNHQRLASDIDASCLANQSHRRAGCADAVTRSQLGGRHRHRRCRRRRRRRQATSTTFSVAYSALPSPTPLVTVSGLNYWWVPRVFLIVVTLRFSPFDTALSNWEIAKITILSLLASKSRKRSGMCLSVGEVKENLGIHRIVIEGFWDFRARVPGRG